MTTFNRYPLRPDANSPSGIKQVLDSVRILTLLVGVVCLSAIVYGQPSQVPSAPPNAAMQSAPAAAPVPSDGPQPLSLLSANHIGKNVTICGTISNQIAPTGTGSRAPHRWYVTDNQGVAMIVLFPDLYSQMTNPESVFPQGGAIAVRGKVNEYRGQLQIVPENVSDLMVPPPGTPQGIWGLGEDAAQKASVAVAPAVAPAAAPAVAPAAPPAQLPATPPEGFLFPGQVTKAMLDQSVKVIGQVTRFRASWSDRAPNVLTISGGGGTIDVVFWRDLSQVIGDRLPLLTKEGQILKVEGTLNEFRESLQLRVEKQEGLALLVPEGQPALPAVATPVAPAVPPAVVPPQPQAAPAVIPELKPSQVTNADVGRTVYVVGTVRAVHQPTSDRAPTRVDLADETGTLSVVYWAEGAAYYSGDKAAQPGQPWKVYGIVSEFRSSLQLRAAAPPDTEKP